MLFQIVCAFLIVQNVFSATIAVAEPDQLAVIVNIDQPKEELVELAENTQVDVKTTLEENIRDAESRLIWDNSDEEDGNFLDWFEWTGLTSGKQKKPSLKKKLHILEERQKLMYDLLQCESEENKDCSGKRAKAQAAFRIPPKLNHSNNSNSAVNKTEPETAPVRTRFRPNNAEFPQAQFPQNPVIYYGPNPQFMGEYPQNYAQFQQYPYMYPQIPNQFSQFPNQYPQNPAVYSQYPQNPTQFPQNYFMNPQYAGQLSQNPSQLPQNSVTNSQFLGQFPQNTQNPILNPQNQGPVSQNPSPNQQVSVTNPQLPSQNAVPNQQVLGQNLIANQSQLPQKPANSQNQPQLPQNPATNSQVPPPTPINPQNQPQLPQNPVQNPQVPMTQNPAANQAPVVAQVAPAGNPVLPAAIQQVPATNPQNQPQLPQTPVLNSQVPPANSQNQPQFPQNPANLQVPPLITRNSTASQPGPAAVPLATNPVVPPAMAQVPPVPAAPVAPVVPPPPPAVVLPPLTG